MIAKLHTSNSLNREGLTSTLGGLIATVRSNIFGLASLGMFISCLELFRIIRHEKLIITGFL